eukprot:jgi/Mesvir1/29613/Mv21465-RA.1
MELQQHIYDEFKAHESHHHSGIGYKAPEEEPDSFGDQTPAASSHSFHSVPPPPAPMSDLDLKKSKAAEIAARLVGAANNPNRRFRTDADTCSSDKIFPPVDRVPGVNWLELLNSVVGPIENDSGAKVLIRGKGSGVEEGAGEELHAQVVGSSQPSVDAATAKLTEILNDDAKRAAALVALFAQAQAHAAAAASHLALSAASPAGDSKTIQVQNSKVGLVIGKGGETIKYLQLQSGARIQVQRDADAEPGAQFRKVELIGTPDQINRAEKLISEVVYEQVTAVGANAGQRMPLPGVNTVTMKVPNNKVGLIIGKGGETIKMLQSTSGARIQVQSDRETPPGALERTVTLIGGKAQTAAAEKLIHEVMAEGHKTGMGGGMGQARGQGGPMGGGPMGGYGAGAMGGGYGAPGGGGYGAGGGAPGGDYGAAGYGQVMGGYGGQQGAYAQQQAAAYQQYAQQAAAMYNPSAAQPGMYGSMPQQAPGMTASGVGQGGADASGMAGTSQSSAAALPQAAQYAPYYGQPPQQPWGAPQPPQPPQPPQAAPGTAAGDMAAYYQYYAAYGQGMAGSQAYGAPMQGGYYGTQGYSAPAGMGYDMSAYYGQGAGQPPQPPGRQ